MSLKRKLSDSLPFIKRVKVYRPSLRPTRSLSVPTKKEIRAKARTFSLTPVLEAAKGPGKRGKEDGEVRRRVGELKQMRREDEVAKASREEERLRQLRKSLQFHAQPIRRYSGLCIKRSERKLTEPHSPKRHPSRRAEKD